MHFDLQERLNSAAYTTRLVALGVRAFELAILVVPILWEMLETSRSLTASESSVSGTSMAELLPAAVAWFRFAGYRLAVLSRGNDGELLSNIKGSSPL